ncbi:MAG: hypothetical protein AAGD04_12005 [Pseudomonadota bacterium]
MTPFEYWTRQVEASADAWARYWRLVGKTQNRMVKTMMNATPDQDMQTAYDTAANSPVELFPKVPPVKSRHTQSRAAK